MSEPLLQAINLSCERDDRLLFRNLDLSIVPGTLTRVEGPNGSGKTTLLRILAGLHDAYSGDILWRGDRRDRQRESFTRNLLYIGHRAGVKAQLTPLENLQALMAGRRTLSRAVLAAALNNAGLAGYHDVPCQSLSAGQQRRVALARLLVSDEPLWILDEAFTALDRDGVAGLERLLVQRVSQGGVVIATTHHPLIVKGMQRIQLAQVTDHVD